MGVDIYHFSAESARVRELISTISLPVYPSSVEWKLKHLYESCMEVDNVDADGVRPLLRIITELGMLSILMSYCVYKNTPFGCTN